MSPEQWIDKAKKLHMQCIAEVLATVVREQQTGGMTAAGDRKRKAAEDKAQAALYAHLESVAAQASAQERCSHGVWRGDRCEQCVEQSESEVAAAPVPALAEQRDDRRRLEAMLPLFEEARDALCAITETQRRLHNISPTLADRMDDVGDPKRWAAIAASTTGSKG